MGLREADAMVISQSMMSSKHGDGGDVMMMMMMLMMVSLLMADGRMPGQSRSEAMRRDGASGTEGLGLWEGPQADCKDRVTRASGARE